MHWDTVNYYVILNALDRIGSELSDVDNPHILKNSNSSWLNWVKGFIKLGINDSSARQNDIKDLINLGARFAFRSRVSSNKELRFG